MNAPVAIGNGTALHFEDVGKIYPRFRAEPSVHALKGISFSVTRGERVALIGRNGAGKSTLLKIVSGHLKPTSGTVKVKGMISALFDMGVGSHEEVSGYENIRSGLMYNNLSEDELAAHVADVISFSELGDYLHHPVRTYSAGMKARLYFAIATAVAPDIVIVDETLGAGDAYFAQKCAERTAHMTREGTTLLLVSHNLALAQQMCRRAIWIEKGEIRAIGAADEVINEYETFVAELGATSRTESTGANGWIERELSRKLMSLASLATAASLRLELETESGSIFRSMRTSLGEGFACRLKVDGPAPSTFRPGIAVFSNDGRLIDCLVGDPCAPGAQGSFVVSLRPLLYGPGHYLLRAVLLSDACDQIFAKMDRSGLLEVVSPDSGETSMFVHPAHWQMSEK